MNFYRGKKRSPLVIEIKSTSGRWTIDDVDDPRIIRANLPSVTVGIAVDAAQNAGYRRNDRLSTIIENWQVPNSISACPEIEETIFFRTSNHQRDAETQAKRRTGVNDRILKNRREHPFVAWYLVVDHARQGRHRRRIDLILGAEERCPRQCLGSPPPDIPSPYAMRDFEDDDPKPESRGRRSGGSSIDQEPVAHDQCA